MRFALLLFCATLSAQKPTPVPIPIGVTAPGRGVNFYSIEKEQALGAQLAADYRRQIRAFDAPSVNAYLDELGQRLAAQSPATGFTFTFELVDDDQTWIHEAAAFPGGPVFVPASLILAVSSEDELAAMLAHAIAHIATRQETRQMTRVQIVNQSAIPLINMGGSSGYAIRQGASLAVPIGFLPFQRKNELESDQLAVRFLSSAGYDPQALARYIERVQPADPPLRNPMTPYPAKDQRLAALQAAIQQLPPATYSAHPGIDAIQREVARLTARPRRTLPTPPRLAR
jgi:predicted Zn-dependent protease